MYTAKSHLPLLVLTPILNVNINTFCIFEPDALDILVTILDRRRITYSETCLETHSLEPKLRVGITLETQPLLLVHIRHHLTQKSDLFHINRRSRIRRKGIRSGSLSCFHNLSLCSPYSSIISGSRIIVQDFFHCIFFDTKSQIDKYHND